MKYLLVLLAVAVATAYASTNWAVLVAGSNGWWNYRHQADVSHAYQILTKHGFDDDHIILMMYDDIAQNAKNPTPGTIINKPNGPNVYPGTDKIDYKGKDVTAANFLKVLQGDASAPGPVLQSGPNDNVFVYFSDHGGPGLIAFPSGGYLYVDPFITALKNMASKHMFKEMTLYIEACEAGSMFDSHLPDNINIYATTAANPTESSWGWYCSPAECGDVKSCLGDEYSVRFLEDLDTADFHTETLGAQYTYLKTAVTKSHVMQYGQMSITPEPIEDFMAYGKFDSLPSPKVAPEGTGIEAHLIPLTMSWNRYLSLTDPVKKQEAYVEFRELVADQRRSDDRIESIHRMLGANFGGVDTLLAKRGASKDRTCFREAVDAYVEHCGEFSDYSNRHMNALANACTEGVSASQLKDIFRSVC